MRTHPGLLPASILLLSACSGQAEPLLTATPPREVALFSVDLWPGEGIPVIELQRPSLPLYADPDPHAAVLDSLHGRVGQRVAFDSTRYQTIESGTMSVHGDFQLSGRDLGNVRRVTLERYYQPDVAEVSIPVDAPSTIDFLQYRAEGTCFVRIAQRVIDAQPCPGFGRESVQVVREPLTRWWVLTRGSAGVSGWLLVSDSTARAVRREF